MVDRKTQGRWVADALVRTLLDLPTDVTILVDSVRIEAQVKAIRQAFGPRVIHVHLTASLQELTRRYRRRPKRLKELSSYEKVRANKTERKVDDLKHIADVVVDTHRSTPDDVVVRVAARLGLYGRSYDRLADVLVGGAYGSEGKGQIAAYLAPEYEVLIRVGGPNAGHTVYEEPEPFTFHQLPSGTQRNLESQLVLGPGAVISVDRVLDEIAKCKVSKERLAIDPQAMIIEITDRTTERALVDKIGSTGQGVGAVRRPQFSWTRIKGESDVKGGGGHGWVEASAGSWVGAAVGSRALAPGQRWSASRKRDVVLRLLRGESLDAVSREVGLEVYRLEAWKARALAGLELGLKAQAGEPLAAELDAAKRHIGELSMEIELLRERARAAECRLPLATRRSRR